MNLPGPPLDLVLAQQDLTRDVAAEKLQFQPDSAALGAPQVPGALEQALGIVLEVDEHARQVGRELVERHGAVNMPLVTLRAPDDAFVRHLIHDFGRPGTMRPEDLCLPLNGRVLLLFDVLDLLQEGGEFLELSPGLVGHRPGNWEVKLFDDIGELEFLVFALVAITAPDCFTHLVFNG